MEIIGADIGNCTTVSSKGVIFTSKTTTECILNDLYKLEMDNKTIYLGDGSYNTTYRKVNKENYIQLLFGLLALSTDEEEINLVLGLPISQYKEDKQTLIQRILSNREKVIKINGVQKRIFISDIEVFPEGAMTVEDDYEGVVIDIGGRTTDICLIEIVNGNRRIKDYTSIPKGTLNLYADFVRSINNMYGLDLSDTDTDRLIRNGLYIDGVRANIEPNKSIFYDFSNDLVSKLQVKYSLKTHRVSLTGGGGGLLYNILHKKIKQLELQENCIFANANAFEELGRSIWE